MALVQKIIKRYPEGRHKSALLPILHLAQAEFGGWLSPVPGLPDGFLWFLLKALAVFFMFAMVKAVVPRYRYDQLMRIGWKVFLPLSLIWLVATAGFLVYTDRVPC